MGECGGYMNWTWTDRHDSEYKCNSKPKVITSNCKWRFVIEPCSDDMLPEGCKWIGK